MSGEHDFYIEARRRERVEEEMRRLEQKIASQREDLIRQQDSKVKQIRNEYDKKLNKQKEHFEKDIKNVNMKFDEKIRKQNADFKSLLHDQKSDLEEMIKKESSELGQRIDSLVKQIDGKKQGEKERAGAWLEQYDKYVEELKQYDYKKFCQSEFKNLEKREKMFKDNLAAEDFQAAISGAQEGCLEAGQLLERVKLLTAEWEFVRNKTMNSLEVLQEFIKNNEKYELEMDSESGKKEFAKFDINNWSGGELKKLNDEIKKRADKLKETEKLTTEDILKINDELSEFKIKVNDVFERAINNYMNHIVRQEIQEVIAEKLEKSGFFVTSNFWEENDERKQNILLLKNGENEQIFVGLEYDSMAEKIQFHWKTDMNNKHDREERAKAIIDSINAELGFNIDKKVVKAGDRDKKAAAEHFNEEKYKKKTRSK